MTVRLTRVIIDHSQREPGTFALCSLCRVRLRRWPTHEAEYTLSRIVEDVAEITHACTGSKPVDTLPDLAEYSAPGRKLPGGMIDFGSLSDRSAT